MQQKEAIQTFDIEEKLNNSSSKRKSFSKKQKIIIASTISIISLIFITSIIIISTKKSSSSSSSNIPNSSSTSTDSSSLPSGTLQTTWYDFSGSNGAFYTYEQTQKYYSGYYTCAVKQSIEKQYNLKGAYIKLTYNNNILYVLNADILPDSDGYNAIDLANDAFSVLADKTIGVLSGVKWEVIKFDNKENKNIHMLVKENGCNNWWVSFKPFYQNYPIKKMEISLDNGKSYNEISVTDYNQYEVSVSDGNGLNRSYYVKFTSINGLTCSGKFTVNGAGVMADTGCNFN